MLRNGRNAGNGMLGMLKEFKQGALPVTKAHRACKKDLVVLIAESTYQLSIARMSQARIFQSVCRCVCCKISHPVVSEREGSFMAETETRQQTASDGIEYIRRHRVCLRSPQLLPGRDLSVTRVKSPVLRTMATSGIDIYLTQPGEILT